MIWVVLVPRPHAQPPVPYTLIVEGVDPDDRRAVRQMLDRMLAHPPREDELDHIIDIAKRAAARLAARPERLPRS